MLYPIIQIFTLVLGISAVISGRKKLITFLICFTLTMDVVAFKLLGPNIPLFRIIGLLLLPQSIVFARQLLTRNASARSLMLNLTLIFVLAILFGYLLPWTDLSHARPWMQQAQGRALISLIRHIADMSVLIYLARVSAEEGMIKRALYAFSLGIAVNVLFALADRFSAGQLSELLFNAQLFGDRLNGLNLEPRVLGRISALGFLISMNYMKRLPRLLGMGVGAAGLFLASSTSAVLGLVAVLGVVAVHDVLRGRRIAAFGLVFGAVILAFAATYVAQGQIEEHMAPRIEAMIDVADRNPSEPAWIAALEVFDRSAVRFFLAHPEYALFGTGPDLISLPASEYMSSAASAIYGDRIDSVPHMGIISILANTGIVGLVLWGSAGFRLYHAHVVSKDNDILRWERTILAVGVFSMFVLTPVLTMMFGLGIGHLSQKDRNGANPERSALSA